MRRHVLLRIVARILGPASARRDSTDHADLEMRETRARINKLLLEQDKLLLERRSLERQLSWQGRWIEWLKAMAVPVTLAGATLAYVVGSGQLRQSEQSRVADRFDKALTRLGSPTATDRVTGVSALRLFLQEHSASHLQSSTLHFLVNAVSVEKDPLVQGAILDVFSSLKDQEVSAAALNEALRTAIERNRTLTSKIERSLQDHVEEAKKKRIAQIRSLKLKAEDVPSPIPESLLARLPFSEYLRLLDLERGPFDDLPPEESVPLDGLTKTISTFIGLGATHHDFSGIFCEGCDFTGAASLAGRRFDDAFLNGADFSRANLQGASFRRADIGGAMFFGANLSGANLSSRYPKYNGFPGSRNFAPYLQCADVSGADLSGLVIAVLWRDYATTWSGNRALQVSAPLVAATRVDARTKMDSVTVIVVTDISDAYVERFPHDRAVLAIRDDVPENPMITGSSSSADRYRMQGHFAADAAEYTNTILIQEATLELDDVGRVKPWAKSALAGFIDQPTWKRLPLIAELSKHLPSSISVPKQRDRATGGPAANPCGPSVEPKPFQLMLDSGTQTGLPVED